ncbi:MAG TPA: hypothetical protein VNA21_12750 [Steroidobacteraceae bacterium]|nr:hypothetical protein [Steroidobacteraceae bacterium]
MRRISAIVLFVSLWVCAATTAQERSLYWDSLTVQARLDAEGAMHVRERHAMVFDGDWNGGERSFRLASWQSLKFQGLREMDPQTQAPISWRDDDLSDVGEYELSGSVLRWRARMPEDPPFVNATRVYEIAYVIEGVLVPDEGRYLLEHNLAFPDRSGAIRTFDATLELDPVWTATDLPTSWHEENLEPGESVFANATLTYAGAGQPHALASVSSFPSATTQPALRVALLLTVLAFAVAHLFAVLRREKRNERFVPPLPHDQIDESWLQENVFNRPPEMIGAAWDLDTSASEVSALLARLAQEGALKSEVRSSGSGWFKRDVMYMELLCDRNRLADHERGLIDALFIGGSRMTDSDKIRQHYSKSGFTPAALIKSGIEAQLPMIFAKRLTLSRWPKLLTVALLVSGIVCFIGAMIQGPDQQEAVFVTSLVLLACYVFSIVFAYQYRTNVYELRARLARTMVAVAAMCAVLAFVLIGGRIAVVTFGLFAIALLTLAFTNSVFNMMRTREMPESLELRRKLVSARLYFEHELKSPTPKLKDQWFPYLLAFGLGPKIDRWFKSVASQSSRTMSRAGMTSNYGGSSSTSSSNSSWTGGGGTFGGAGASGAWSAAVGSIASGVAKPSSSSSGGRSSSSGSSRSSGGGGGGGW